MNVAGPNCYVVLRDGCIYIFRNERSKAAQKSCSLYGFLEYERHRYNIYTHADSLNSKSSRRNNIFTAFNLRQSQPEGLGPKVIAML